MHKGGAIVILTKAENVKELLKWLEARGIQITRKELLKETPYTLQVARRAACLHGVMPRMAKRILDRKRAEEAGAQVSLVPKAPRTYPDWKMRAANDDSLD